MRFSRRKLLLGSLGAVGGARGVAELGFPIAQAAEEQPPSAPADGPTQTEPAIEKIQPEESQALNAACERLLPGAIEAGVPEYIDYWMSREPFSKLFEWRRFLKIGAVNLNRVAQREHQKAFADCAPEQQDAILKRFQEGTEKAKGFGTEVFFQRLLGLTVEGYFSDPKYGGNRHEVGWRMIGYQPCWWAPRLHSGH